MARRSSPLRAKAPARADSTQPARLNLRLLTGVALLVSVTGLAYLPAVSCSFIWDDNELVTDNSLVHAPDGLYRLWCTAQSVDYWPLTYTTFWLEWRLWGMNATGYHVTNLVLHIAAALLIWAILSKLSIPGAYLAALLFAVHPVNVESVAWIAQRKNTLAMLFFLLSVLWYLYAEEEKSRRGEEETRGPAGLGRWYWLSLLAFLLAMLSKGSVAILPVVLLGIVWWQSRRAGITWRDVVRIAPFFVVAAVLAAVNVWFQKHGADVVFREGDFAQRLAGAGAIVWFYLSKSLVPIDLIFVYPQWRVDTSDLLWCLPTAAAATVTALLWRRRYSRWGRSLLFAWGFFCVALLPVLGFTDVYFMKYSIVADHYQYIALIGAMALVAAGWSAWHNRPNRSIRWLPSAAAAIVVGALTILTYKQTRIYENSFTLFQTTIARNPACWMAHNELGSLLAGAGRTAEAIQEYRQALRIKPDHANALNNLALQLAALGRFDEALENYQQALRLNPNFAEAHVNLGGLLLDTGQLPEAIEQYQQAVRCKPYLTEAHYGLAIALGRAGRSAEAIAAAQQAALLARSHGQTTLAQQIEAWLSINRPQSANPSTP